MGLEFTEIGYPTSGGQISGPAFMYEVRLPSPNQKVFIADFGTPHNPTWRIRHEIEGKPKEWEGNYNSRDDALAAIEKAIAA